MVTLAVLGCSLLCGSLCEQNVAEVQDGGHCGDDVILLILVQ